MQGIGGRGRGRRWNQGWARLGLGQDNLARVGVGKPGMSAQPGTWAGRWFFCNGMIRVEVDMSQYTTRSVEYVAAAWAAG